jgi:hypothetical protein
MGSNVPGCTSSLDRISVCRTKIRIRETADSGGRMAQGRTQPRTARTSSWETNYLVLKGVRHAERNAEYADACFGWIYKIKKGNCRSRNFRNYPAIVSVAERSKYDRISFHLRDNHRIVPEGHIFLWTLHP